MYVLRIPVLEDSNIILSVLAAGMIPISSIEHNLRLSWPRPCACRKHIFTPQSFFVLMPCKGITGTLCQLFFAYRIKILTGSSWLGYGIATLSVASGLCAIGSGIAVSWVKFLADFDKFQAIGCLWLGLTALVDILITVIVSSFLVSSYSLSCMFSSISLASTKGRV